MSAPPVRALPDGSVPEPVLDIRAEWLEVDGRSGYSCGTVGDRPARRYHGWLVHALGARRYMALVRAVETVLDGPELELTAFEPRPWPVWTFAVGDRGTLTRELLRPQDANGVLWRYRFQGKGSLVLRVEPRWAHRDADDLHFANDALEPLVQEEGPRFRFCPYPGLPSLTTWVPQGAEFAPAAVWYHGVELATDLERGYGGHEDHFAPGCWEIELGNGDSVTFAAFVGEGRDPDVLWRDEVARRGPEPVTVRERLTAAGQDFVYRDAHGRAGILAGFPWFGEWGRDTFLSLPGLSLASGRPELSAEVLQGALPFLQSGLLPNIYGADVDDSHYGSVDASLWFSRAAVLHYRATSDADFALEVLRPALIEIAEAYRDGTDLGVAADEDLVLFAGDETLNATWMDAFVDGEPVTPRHGAPVELNALWYQLLAFLRELAEAAGDATDAADWGRQATIAGQSFLDRFWLADAGHLADVFGAEGPDPAIRPNMVLAAAQELSPLSRQQRRAVVDVTTERLLTPRGLRTLDPAHPAYVARYEGHTGQRDRAYHQGTVWPWLTGSYVEASLRAGYDSAADRSRLTAIWRGMEPELERAGLEHLSEVFDGDAPQRPGGTFAQAWNTAEWLRSLAMLEAAPPEAAP